jgi:hypothetical protein
MNNELKYIIILFAMAVLVKLALNCYNPNPCNKIEEYKMRIRGKNEEEKNVEPFGVYDSLYSNTGIQDIHLTVENRRGMLDPYYRWRGIPFWLPTRTLNNFLFYPHMYDYYVDRYGRQSYYY